MADRAIRSRMHKRIMAAFDTNPLMCERCDIRFIQFYQALLLTKMRDLRDEQSPPPLLCKQRDRPHLCEFPARWKVLIEGAR
jgi:hypothetical protein